MSSRRPRFVPEEIGCGALSVILPWLPELCIGAGLYSGLRMQQRAQTTRTIVSDSRS